MGFVSGAEVAFWMVGDDAQGLVSSVKAVLRFLRNNKDQAGDERDFAIRSDAMTSAADNDADPVGGVGVLGLVGIGRNVKKVETWISPANRRDEERVGAAINVAEATFFFDRSTEVEKSAKTFPGDGDSVPTRNLARSGNRGIHSGCQRELQIKEAKGGLSFGYEKEVGAVIRKVEAVSRPTTE